MEIQLWWIGKTSFPYLKEGVADYQKRISHLCKFSIKEWDDVKVVKEAKVLAKLECDQWMKHIKQDDMVILCDEHGQTQTSREFANFIELNLQSSFRRLIFIIGGAYGFSEEFKSKSHAKVSFSKLTFSHQLFRLIFLEQLYRAFSIIKSIPYHHD
ncbi:MAG: 23S rRNA (pseudouridine(1915)-N(3))-methyltransferase RlmH [Saprospiraceae bacterium]|nr:23S rRNA (pseudouridine(1915)-N(3))-methyltransferase RlmH [Saprospiraceae bacterium]MBK7811743.1 23S rRNA (pseudouridine(1915)-N(3))-methyltransferase RlmH [Saprospiraceae bacterium]MBK9631535.1 23S rRNA (pseudouridine(1915)-N(3))-methyltransferase RlmH [Saprospiraceae bacterium]